MSIDDRVRKDEITGGLFVLGAAGMTAAMGFSKGINGLPPDIGDEEQTVLLLAWITNFFGYGCLASNDPNDDAGIVPFAALIAGYPLLRLCYGISYEVGGYFRR